MQLRIKVPKDLRLKEKIVGKYTHLYREYRKFYPERKNYTYQQLRKNIADVASIITLTIDSQEVHNATFIPWLDNNWKQFYFKHWYFALTIKEENGAIIAIVKDAHYEGDHHNDVLLSKPYDADDNIEEAHEQMP